jgi:hypothetical protein
MRKCLRPDLFAVSDIGHVRGHSDRFTVPSDCASEHESGTDAPANFVRARREVDQRVVRPDGVVVDPRLLDRGFGFLQRAEDFAIKQFVA